MHARVETNNFCVNCVRIFRSSLNGCPVVVVTSNDGCAVARSNKAKAVGIARGAPWFKIKHCAENHGLVAFKTTASRAGRV